MKIQKNRYFSFLLLSVLFFVPTVSFTQNNSSRIEKLKSAHIEVPNDKYVPMLRKNMEKSAACQFKGSNFFTVQVNIDENGNNIVGDAANETSIAVDPTNPNRMAIGWRQFDNVNNDFRQAGYGYTTNKGQTWTFPGVIDSGVFRSDPVLDFDADGNFFYNSLTADEDFNFECKVYRILDGGVEWDDGVYAYGGDKQWMRIDKTNGIGNGNNYSFWSYYASTCNGAFTRAAYGGNSYESCIFVEENPIWGTLAVGPSGELYIAGASNDYPIVVIKSTDAQNMNNPVTWAQYTSVNLDGELAIQDPINPQGLIGQVWVDVDMSTGPGSGNVYVLASVTRSSVNDPADVMFAKSTDGGQTFSDPIRINKDLGNTNRQWFGTMSVAPNGRIDVVWLDTRDAPEDSMYFSSLYYSFSTNQGETWSVNQRLSDAFDPHVGWPQQQKMGDYYDMVSDNEGVHLAWANTLNGGQDVYYTHITPVITGINETFEYTNYSVSTFPNPFANETTISFSLNKKEDVTIEVYDLMGRKAKTLLNKNMNTGQHKVKWDGCNDNGLLLPQGFYLLRFNAGNFSQSQKILMIQ